MQLLKMGVARLPGKAGNAPIPPAVIAIHPKKTVGRNATIKEGWSQSIRNWEPVKVVRLNPVKSSDSKSVLLDAA